MAKIRVGVIGCGGISKSHFGAWQATGYGDVVACCDADEARARERAEAFGVPHVYTDWKELLKRICFQLLCCRLVTQAALSSCARLYDIGHRQANENGHQGVKEQQKDKLAAVSSRNLRLHQRLHHRHED